MVTCEVCGGENFVTHAGYMYCAVCQTQSQDYHEQECEFVSAAFNTSRIKPQKQSTKQKKAKVCDDGVWTSWEAFNYILYGMTQELKKCGAPIDFESVVLKLWAFYLKACKIAFISKYKEEMPRLRINFKDRDARVLYNIDAGSVTSSRTKRKSVSSRTSNTSNSSISSISKRSLSMKKGKIIATDYNEMLSTSVASVSNLADETLESLGRSSEIDLSEDTSDTSQKVVQSMKNMFSKKDYNIYKKSYKSPSLMANVKLYANQSVKFVSKNKLLSILHLALLMSGSEIQLSDLLRFIREGHLSYAKVTHFLPGDIKFSPKDFSYIDVISDNLMPTHLKQRKISSQLAHLFKIESMSIPDLNLLVERYCSDLNLPEDIQKYSSTILKQMVPRTVIPRSKSMLPSYEAWAMVSIIFTMKLLFGLNDETEIFLSHLARKVNSIRKDGAKLFVFEDWQNYIECRKTVLINFHYPTQEQLNPNGLHSCKNFINVLMKESKDEHRSERFIPYKKYYMENSFMDGIKQTLNTLTKPHIVQSIEFQPSLTPQMDHLETIIQAFAQGLFESSSDSTRFDSDTLPKIILEQNFNKHDVEFTFNPEESLKLFNKSDKFFEIFGIKPDFNSEEFKLDQSKSNNHTKFLESSTKYWTLHYPNVMSGHLANFKDLVFEKMPRNFQWLITECARMLEMNVRDVYDELLRFENKFAIT